MSRDNVYKIIDSEREYQDSLRPDIFTETIIPLAGEILCIDNYVSKLKSAYVNSKGESPQEALEIVRKVAGLCVRIMEHYKTPQRVWE